MMHPMLLSSRFRPSFPSTCSSINSYRWSCWSFWRWPRYLSCNISTRTLRWATQCKYREGAVRLIWTAPEQSTSWSHARFRTTACMKTWAKSIISSATKQEHSPRTSSSLTSGHQTAPSIQNSSSSYFKELSSALRWENSWGASAYVTIYSLSIWRTKTVRWLSKRVVLVRMSFACSKWSRRKDWQSWWPETPHQSQSKY